MIAENTSLELREREAAGRQRAQATLVLMWEERLDYDPRVSQVQRVVYGDSSAGTITAHIKNNSEQPIYNVVVAWHRRPARWGESDLRPSLMPGAEVSYIRSIPRLLDDVDPAVWGAVAFFRDAAGTHWRRGPDGQLDEIPSDQVPRN